MSASRSARRRPQTSTTARRRLQVEALEDRRLLAIAVAENLLVNLDARDPSAGSASWTNTGSLVGNFAAVGTPQVVTRGPNSNVAVSFNEQGANTDAYRGPNAPLGIASTGATRSIEVWAFNPTIDPEETLVSIARRGGPDGSNMSFNYGNNGTYGAAGQWGGGPDMGWGNNGANTPAANQWHHLVITYDGNVTSVYADGALLNREIQGALPTAQGVPILIAAQATDAAGNIAFGGTMGRLSIGNVRIHNGVLTPDQVVQNYNSDAVRYGKPVLVSQGAPAPIHRYSFTTDGNDSIGGANATLFNGASIVNGELVLTNTLSSNDANGQYATLPISNTIARTNTLTFESWFTLTDTPNWQRLFDFGYDTNRYIFVSPTTGLGGGEMAFELKDEPAIAGVQRLTDARVEANLETHIAAVIDVAANQARFYVNGRLVGIDMDLQGFSPLGLGATANNYLGRSFFNDPYLRGRINEFRVYDSALTSEQVLASYANGPNVLNSGPTAANDTFYSTSEDAALNVNNSSPAITSYNVPLGTIGNQAFGGSLGLDFDVTQQVYVDQLGVFDSGSNGLVANLTARLYNRATQTQIASLTFTPADPGTISGGSRFKRLSTPIILPAGFQGTIVAEGYTAGEPNGNSMGAAPVWTTAGGGAINFVGVGRNGNAGSFPTNLDGGPANRYAAGTFTFSTSPPLLLANDTDPNGNGLQSVAAFAYPVINADFNNNQTPANMLLNRNTGTVPPTWAVVQNGQMELTQAANNLYGTAVINKPNPSEQLQSIDATFNLFISQPGNGADGVNFVYGPMNDNAVFGENFAGFPGLQVQFDTYENNGTQSAFAIKYNDVDVVRMLVNDDVLETESYVPVSITVNAAGQLTLMHNGNTIFSNLQIPGWAPQSNWRFGMGARTGGATQRAYVDDLNISGVNGGNQTVSVIDANFDDNQQPSNIIFNRAPAIPAVVQNQRLELTQAANSLQGTAIISKPDSNQLLPGFFSTFDMLIGNPAGNGADGVAFVYGDLPDSALFGENYGGAGLQIQFDTYDNGGGEAPAFKLVYNNVLVKRVNVTDAVLETNVFTPVSINVTPNGVVTLHHDNNLIFSTQITNWNPQSNWRFAIGSRTGGSNERAYIDNLSITGLVNYAQTNVGANVTVNADGSFTYDPLSSAFLNTLSQGQVFSDSFDYTVSDGVALSTATATVNVIGVNDPVFNASAGGPYTIAEGETLNLSASVMDVDANDTHTFSWDLDGDGQYDDASGGPNIAVPWSTLISMTNPITDQVVGQVIRVRASDGLSTTDAQTTLTVTNAPPTVSFVDPPVKALLGTTVDFELEALDPAPADQSANFTYVVNWGDGSAPQTFANRPSSTVVSHAYANPSPGAGYTVTVTATDKDGGTSAPPTSHVIEISQSFEEDGIGYFAGTNRSERIILQSSGNGVQVKIGREILATFIGVYEIQVFANGGSDQIVVSGKIPVNFVLNGGEGNDYIAGGIYDDILRGDGGNDRLLGGNGDDLLEGGDGNDRLSGGNGNDMLYGGAGRDQIYGDNGDDQLFGDEGNDRLVGGNGSDLLRGGDGNDQLDGGNDADVLDGGDGSDKLYGRNGADVLIGGLGFDTLYGGSGEDLMIGGVVFDDTDEGLYFLLSDWLANSFDENITTYRDQFLSAVDDDGVGDTLYGERDADWFLLFAKDLVRIPTSQDELTDVLNDMP
jgi:hypothetical protein